VRSIFILKVLLCNALIAEQSLFDGKTLNGWSGNSSHWSVQNQSIVGTNTKQNPTKGNTFLIWKNGTLKNFDLSIECKIETGNSGIQYRSFLKPGNHDGFRVGGYQADFESGDKFSGICYGESFRGILSLRGDSTILSRTSDGKLIKKITKIGNATELGSYIKKNQWNHYRIIANGFHFEHYINNKKMCEVIDNDVKHRKSEGLLALQVHAGPPMKVYYRNIILK